MLKILPALPILRQAEHLPYSRIRAAQKFEHSPHRDHLSIHHDQI
jgi:hypothetical protein